MARAVLTIDLGTSATKAALWLETERVGFARVAVATNHPGPGRSEQDAEAWWASVVEACRRLRARDRAAYALVHTIGFSSARETFVPVDGAIRPLGAAIVWSDRRAARFVETLGDAAGFRAATGVVAGPAVPAAKAAWLAAAQPHVWDRTRWFLAPRDFVVARLCGAVVTDRTLAARTGYVSLDGSLRPLLGADRLPPIVDPTDVLGVRPGGPIDELDLDPACRVVVGAGDRACEVLGTGASAEIPMVSWGTTANVAAPGGDPGRAATCSPGVPGGTIREAGLGAAGSAVAWLAQLTGRDDTELLDRAVAVGPGARGALALPWLHGARAPWWRGDARAAFLGVTAAHGVAELTRAILEGVAVDATRALDRVGPRARALALAGTGAGAVAWQQVLAGVTGLALRRRRHDEAASVGARLVVASALGEPLSAEVLNPVTATVEPDAVTVEAYRAWRVAADAAATAVVDLPLHLG